MSYFIPEPKSFSTNPFFASPMFVSGLKQTILDETHFTISSGCARDVLSDFALVFDGLSGENPGFLTVDVSKVGLNACYPWALDKLPYINNTIFPVYIVGNPSGTGVNRSPAVIVATGDEFLPENYSAYCRIGFVTVFYDAAEGPLYTLKKFIQSGDGTRRVYQAQTPDLVYSASLTAIPQQVPLSIVNYFVPPKPNVEIMLSAPFSANDEFNDLLIGSDDTFSTLSVIPAFSSLTSKQAGFDIVGSSFTMISGYSDFLKSSVIYARIAPLYSPGPEGVTGQVQIFLLGFVDELGFSYY